MATQTFEQLKQLYYDKITSLDANIAPDIKGSDTYFKANATAQVAAQVAQDIQEAQNNIIPSSGAGPYLDKTAGSLGMTPRQGALPAQGNLTDLIADTGTTAAADFNIPINTELFSPLTNQTYRVTQVVNVASGDTLAAVVIPVQSVNLGAGTNSPAGDILNFVIPLVVSGSQSILTAAVASTGMTVGSDAESDNLLAQRIFDFMVTPRGGGSDGDYKKWCFLGSSNVTQAQIITTFVNNFGILFPIIFEGSPDANFYIDGNATNDYMETPYPINRAAPALDIGDVQAYIGGVRPVNDNPDVITVSTYALNATDSIFGAGSYFNAYVTLSAGITLSTQIQLATGAFITVENLINREFRRAIISTQPGGSAVEMSSVTDNYILVSTIEETIALGLSNTQSLQGNYASILSSIRIEYHAQGSPTATYFVPVPSESRNNLFQIVGSVITAYVVYDIDVSIINITVI